MKRYALFFAFLFLLLGGERVLAHKPIFVEPGSNTTRPEAIRIDDPQVSWAIYAQLSQASEVNYYVFKGRPGQSIEIDVSVPRIESERAFGVTIALLGRGLAQPPSAQPFAMNADEGVIIATDPATNSRVFDEPFTQTSYWQRQSLNATLPADDLYTVAVYNPRGDTGKYVLALGTREEFGANDLLNFPRTWFTVKQFFGDTNALLIPIAGIGFALIAGFIIVFKFIRNW